MMNSRKILITGSLILSVVFSANAERYKYENAKKGNDNPPGTAANCTPATASAELDINNTRALIQSGGDMWWDFNRARYEIPKGSDKTSLFAGSLWLAGQDVSGQFKVAALRFRGGGNDYWTGPLSTVDAEIDPATCKDYDKHFISTKAEVSEFAAWWQTDQADKANGTNFAAELYPGYTTPQFIKDWPWDGRNYEPYNEDPYLAPFHDENGDGEYNPDDGDYPGYVLTGSSDCSRRVKDLYGDQNLWWVFNDKGNIHSESGGQSIGMEIRAQAFAFATTDEVNNMTFYNYELINRSTFSLTDTYFGQWVDGDLGNAQDDYVGCDVKRGLGYFYNGDDEDEDAGGNIGYGNNPPAIGVDFFQGPFQANDAEDNCLCLNDYAAAIEEDGIIYAGQGAGYGDGIVDNERYGMRKFLYHNNAQGPTGDPSIATDYYNMLRGIWKDGTPMTYGGNGYDPSNANAIPSSYMFPGTTDTENWGTNGEDPGATNWSEVTAGNPKGDRRFVQSSGPFELGPGAVNNITVGIVWMQATSGGRLQSVEDMRKADDKTQALFDSCFEILDGPNSPDVTVQELDREVILMLSNPVNSNNYQEGYAIKDPFLPAPDSIDTGTDGIKDTKLTNKEKEVYSTYVFEGYQIFQLADGTVGTNDLDDPDKARLVAQVDIANDVTRLINYEYNSQIDADIPILKVDGANEGIEHSFQFTDDAFATGDARLINHKTYYYMAVAYAYNEYGGDFGNLQFVDGVYDPSSDPPRLEGQKIPYLASRTSAAGPVQVYEAIPHKIELEQDGIELNSSYGDGVELTRVEGRGNGANFVNIKEDYLDEAQTSETQENLVFEAGDGPVKIKVVDPLSVPPGTFTLTFKDSSLTHNLANMYWELSGDSIATVTADQTVRQRNEQVIFDLGLSVSVEYGRPAPRYPSQETGPANNGYIGFELSFEDPTDQWLAGIPDVDANDAFNWIKSGTTIAPFTDGEKQHALDDHHDDYTAGGQLDDSGSPLDENQVWENIAGRTWAPFALTSYDTAHPIPLFAPNGNLPYVNLSEHIIKIAGIDNTPSVDVVITTDCSKWTRCPVFEAGENPSLTQGGAVRGELRRALSVDKSGRNQLDAGFNAEEGFGTTASGAPQVLGADRVAVLTPEHQAYLVSLGIKQSEMATVSTGMGWFPGYAIDVETGERLNMAFSEDSWLGKENGADMVWNPTDRIVEELFGELRMGGKQMIYVFRHNTEDGGIISDDELMPAYVGDGGTFAYDRLVGFSKSELGGVVGSDQLKPFFIDYMSVMRAGAWVGYPLLAEGATLFGDGYSAGDDCDGDSTGNDVTIKLRAARPYRPYAVGDEVELPATTSLSVGAGYYVKSGKISVNQTDAAGDLVVTEFGAGDAFTAEEAGYTISTASAVLVNTVNQGLPLYTFNTDEIAPTMDKEIGKDMLESINVVPNPYYAYSEYETGRLDYRVKIINLPEECTVNIFTVNGILVRTYNKDDATISSIDWDLKNQDAIPIASGLYIIHVNAPGLGEKVIKWFGVLRPIDLNSF